MLGGEREVRIFNPTGTDTTLDINSANPGIMNLSHGTSSATTQLIYDGVGSGGFSATDFTAGGDDAIRFLVTNANANAISVQIDVTSALGSSTIFDSGATAPGTLDLLYSSFTTTSGSGADFSALTSIIFTFVAPIAFEDAAYNLVGTANTVPDIVISEPGTLAVLGLGMIGLAGYRRRMTKKS